MDKNSSLNPIAEIALTSCPCLKVRAVTYSIPGPGFTIKMMAVPMNTARLELSKLLLTNDQGVDIQLPAQDNSTPQQNAPELLLVELNEQQQILLNQ